MLNFNLTPVVDNTNLIDYDLFTVLDSTGTNTLINLSELEASDKLINFKLRKTKWVGYKKDINGSTVIGYQKKVDINGLGLTEAGAYSIWIEMFKDVERRFKKLFPLNTLSQSQYDAMLSLYADTGSFSHLGTDDRKFNLLDNINNRLWNYVATAMTLSGLHRGTRQSEAKILMLSDYGIYKNRSLIKEEGIQTLVKEYGTGQLNDEQKKQAEYVYYAETNRFLPNMTESRKRLLAKLLS